MYLYLGQAFGLVFSMDLPGDTRLSIFGCRCLLVEDEYMQPCSDGIHRRLADVLTKIRSVTWSDIEPWLDTPNRSFDGRRPRDLLCTPDEHRLLALVDSVASGAYT